MKNKFKDFMAEELVTVDRGVSVNEVVATTIGAAVICWAAPVAVAASSAALGIGMAAAGVGTVINLFTSTK